MADFSKIPWIAEHIQLYKTDPEKAHFWDSSHLGGPGILPTLLLTTTGRKTGQPRSLPLIYGEHGDSFIIIASKGGMAEHPLWFENLQNNPDASIQVGAQSLDVSMRIAEGNERQEIWGRMAAIYPPYDEYQEKTGGRIIPVVVLTPR